MTIGYGRRVYSCRSVNAENNYWFWNFFGSLGNYNFSCIKIELHDIILSFSTRFTYSHIRHNGSKSPVGNYNFSNIKIELHDIIPSLLGLPLISGLMEKRKLWMHIAVVFGLLCAIGGTRFFMVMSKDDVSDYAKGSMLMLLVTGAIYTFLCVKSFRFARINATE